MRTVSNVIARIILLVVGALIIYAAALEIIAAVKVLNVPETGWWNFANETARNAMLVFLLAVVNVIIGLTALFAGIRGKRSFWLFFFSLILMITPVYTVVTQVQGGTFVADWEHISKLILEFLTPILYFVGCLLLVKNDKQ